jgi:group I intron endonuclease
MWFNKITGKVYVGSSVNGSRRLSGYYQPSILKRKYIIYQSILKHGHANFSLIILEICSDNIDYEYSKKYILGREAYYLD